MIKLDSLKSWYYYLTNMLVQTQWQKSTIVVAPSRTQLLKYTVQGSVKIFFWGEGFTPIHVCLFVCNRDKILSWPTPGKQGARALGHSPMNDSHCAFSSNLFHGYIAQIYIDQLSDPENKKCSP